MKCTIKTKRDELSKALNLPNRHGAEDVEEYEAAVSHVIAQQVPVAQTLTKTHLITLEKTRAGHIAL